MQPDPAPAIMVAEKGGIGMADEFRWVRGADGIRVLGPGDELLAEVTFHDAGGGTVDIDHTFVSEQLRGRGIAGRLVRAAAEQIRETGASVTASCPYAADWLRRNSGEEPPQ